MEEACGTHRTDEKCIQIVGKNLMETNHLVKPGIAGRTGLKYVLKKYGVEWVHVVHDRDQWRTLVKIV
jgi:hypothetical protein